MRPNRLFWVVGAFAALGYTSFVLSGRAQSQPGAKALVQLQPTTPGTAQTGHANLAGILRAEYVQGVGNQALATVGGFNTSTSYDAAGVAGYSYAETGFTKGLYGVSWSNEGIGAYGWALSPTGTTYGIFGLTNSSSGYGVYGRALANSGLTYGVYGTSESPNGIGVFGRATSTSGTNYGARFEAVSTSGRGVFAYAKATSGNTYGGYFQSDSSGGRAVFGWATASSGQAYGGTFESGSVSGRGVYGSASAATGTTYGVYGGSTSPDGRGVFGTANAGFGGGNGVRGESNSPDGRGVLGYASANNGTNYGIRGQSDSPTGYGVYSVGAMGGSGTKSFRIDHPDDPENKYLLHYSTESPEILNAYSGTITLGDDGGATVELPHYFAKINKDPRYTLTAVGAPMPMLHVAVEIDAAALGKGAKAEPGENAPRCFFRVAGGAPGKRVSWRVEAVRNDRWVQQRGAPVEVEKEGIERGKYQHPEFYGQSPEAGMNPPTSG